LAAGGFVSDATFLEQAIIVRFNANGTLDPGFNGGDAFVLPTLGTDTYRYSDLYSLEVLPDGRILAGGYARSSDRETEGASLWRFNANGTRDETFGAFGNTTWDLSNIAGNENIASLAPLPDGRVFAAGQNYGFYLYDASGSLLRVQAEMYGPAIARQGADKVLVATPFEGGVRLVRYLADGTPDASFATVDMNFGPWGTPRPAALLPRPDGSVLVGANVTPPPAGDVMAYVARLLPNFGGGGFPQAFLFTGGYQVQDGLRRLVPTGPDRVLAAGYSVQYRAPGDTFAGTNFISTRLALDPGIIAQGRQTGPAVEGTTAPLAGVDSSYTGGSIVKYE
jgi:uncharacterized delta-60 repeat protein